MPAFGAGGAEPYATMLATPHGGRLALRRVGEVRGTVECDVEGWRAPADADDCAVLADLEGPLIDVGCGPGRMVRAAEERAMPALGVDVSSDAAAMAASTGSSVLCRSVFDRLPLEGQWRTVLLMDGNVGIGGDPTGLLRRCAELLAPEGVIVVEVDGDPELWDCDLFTAMDAAGQESAPFPWARLGHIALSRVAASAGLTASDTWRTGQRSFVLLRRVSG